MIPQTCWKMYVDVVSTERVLHLMLIPGKLRQDVIRAAQPQMADGDGSHLPRCFKKRGIFGDQICYLDLVEIIGDTKLEKKILMTGQT